jgi:hypothetical protein
MVRVGDALPHPFTQSTITSEVVGYAPAKRADTFPLLLLYPYMYSVVYTKGSIYYVPLCKYKLTELFNI